MPRADLARTVGSPPESTIRVYLRQLLELGILEKRKESAFPGVVDYALTTAGVDLLEVSDVLQRWLHGAPDGPISLGSTAAKSAIKALVDGWNLQIVRILSTRPLALTELSRLITTVNYPTLERRLSALRVVGLVESSPERAGRLVPYEASSWLRAAAPLLAVAAGWERRHIPEQSPRLNGNDIQSVFVLAVPNLELTVETSGTCRLSVEMRSNSFEPEFAGVTVCIQEGRPTSCVTQLRGDADALVNGSSFDWLRWISRDSDQIEVGGDTELADAVAEALRRPGRDRSLV